MPVDLEKMTLFDLFHNLWTKAVGTKDYNKAEWIEMQNRLFYNHKESNA